MKVTPWNNGEQDITFIAEVWWFDESAKFELLSHPINPIYDVIDFDEEDTYKVVGNIYENPELLKEENL